MAKTYRVGIVGTGRPWNTEGATGFGMAHEHVKAYLNTGRCEVVAVADNRRELAEMFAKEYPSPTVYTDHKEMLAKEKLDVVSLTVWPHLHCPMTIDCAEAGVRAVHCEKPMAPTWGEAKKMHEVCERLGVQLTFNHQRRFNDPFVRAKKLIGSGAIGALQRLEGSCGDLFDWGTHWINMFFFYNNETPAEWVIGQFDARQEKTLFGQPMDTQGLIQVKFRNGVMGTLFTGEGAEIGAANRIIGTQGVIELLWSDPPLRFRVDGMAGWQVIETDDGMHGDPAHTRNVNNLLDCLETGQRPLSSSHWALQNTEVILAAYESSRRRGRVDLPLTGDDSAFLTMLEQGLVGPHRKA